MKYTLTQALSEFLSDYKNLELLSLFPKALIAFLLYLCEILPILTF